MTEIPLSQRQKGGALIYVLWVSMILSALLFGTIKTTRTEIHTARVQLDRFLLSRAMESALAINAYRASTDVNFLTGIDKPFSIVVDGYSFKLHPYLSYAPLDINVSSEQEISAHLIFLGLTSKDANRLAAQIADWRDPDDLVRVNGAEKRDYVNVSNGTQPQNRAFVSVDELLFVKDMSKDLFDCVRPSLSVISGAHMPGKALLEALYGRTPERMHSERNGRRLGTASNALRGGVVFGFQIEGAKIGKTYPRIKRTALFRTTGKAETPFEQLAIYFTVEKQNNTALCREIGYP